MASPLQKARAEIAAFAAHLAKLTNREISALARLSPAVHFATCVRIFNKANELIRPVPNILQLRISAAFEAFEAVGVPLRAVVCKPRQTGGSTFVGHVGQVWSKRKRIDGLTVSDVAKNSAHLVGRIQEYDAHDRFNWGVELKATADKIDFSNGSVMAIGTAENMKEGIGRTRQWFHASEVGKWPKTTVKNDMKIMAAILPSVPKTADNEPVFSVVFAESTPEGATGWMATTYRGAVTLEVALDALAEGKAIPGNGWVKIFAAWHEFAEHTIEAVTGRRLTPPEIVQIERTLTDREREGIERYAWTWEQVAWRRFMIDNECGGDEERFDEYYPEDDVRCLGADNRISTARGLLPISEVRDSDVLPNGTVVKAWQSGMKAVGELTTACGYRVECTADHLVQVAGGKWEQAGQSVGKEIVLQPPVFAERNHVVEWTGFGGAQCRIEVGERWGRWLGYFAGDGSIYKNQVSMVVDGKDADLVELLAGDFAELFGFDATRRKPKAAKCIELRGYDIRFPEILRRMGVTKESQNGEVRKVCVPEVIWRSGKGVVRQFLAGLFEADGHVRRTGRAIQFHSKDKRFCQDVLLLLLGFGVRGKLRPVLAKLKGKEYPGWQIVIYAGYVMKFYEEIGFLSERKRGFEVVARKPSKGGKRVEVLGDGDTVASFEERHEKVPVWDIMMSDEPEFAAGGVMVHNCWLTSGRPRFNVGRLEQMRRVAEGVRPDLVKLGDMGSDGVAVTRVGGIGEADALVWEEPREGMAYVLSLDPATGASQTHGKDPDGHSAQVWRRGYVDENGVKHRHKLVARLVPGCRWDVDQAAIAVACLSKYYGGCLVMLETNMGGGFLELFKLMGVSMYEREVIDPRSPNRVKPLVQIGWKLTDREQRNSLIECLATAIRMDDIEVLCVAWIRQAQAFVVDETGKASARAGSHDDDVMAGAMGVYGLPNATIYTGKVRRRKKPRDWDHWRPVGGARRGGGRGAKW